LAQWRGQQFGNRCYDINTHIFFNSRFTIKNSQLFSLSQLFSSSLAGGGLPEVRPANDDSPEGEVYLFLIQAKTQF
ncbi:MAG: hypothetical protein IIW53_01700, partial [Rikenellaceae bacterium]|nr:hypothetical protein [Rikenellaceae bacterium]